jgi:TPR repeat protein
LYETAADKGDAFAQMQLGLRYAKGEGVTQDYVQAHKWVNLAAVGGDAEAAKSRDVFAKLMTAEQVAEAQRLAREWTQKHRAPPR